MNSQVKEHINLHFLLENREQVKTILSEIYQNEWGVGKDQLALSLLKFSCGSLDKLRSYFPIIDPRDIIMEAM